MKEVSRVLFKQRAAQTFELPSKMIKVVVLLVALISVVVAKPSLYPGGLVPLTTPSSKPMMRPTLPEGLVPPPPPSVNTTAPTLPPYQPPVVFVVPPQQFFVVDCPPVIQYW